MLAAVFGLLTATGANAATPVSPPGGSTTTSTPSFSWQLGVGERSSTLEISPNPAPGQFGRFADDEDRRLEFLQDPQTNFTVGDSEPLFAGTWYWHLETEDQDYNSYFTPTLSFQVPDEPPTLSEVKVNSYECLKQIDLTFDHSDNSRDQFVRWQLDFLRHRKSGRVARIVGSTNEEFGTSETLGIPHKLKVGKRYWTRLRIIDPAGHRVTSKPRPLRLRGC